MLLVVALAPAQAATKIQHLISPGGIEAWFVQDATVPLIAMEYAFAGGAAQDPKDKPGVANMVASLIDEGSGDLDSRTYHERLDRRAIDLSFSATRDYFRGSLRMLRDNKDEAFELLHLALTSPHFDKADVERIRSQIISGLHRDTSSPNALASRKFLEIAFGDHPYSRTASGTLESVPTITVDDMKDYVRRVIAKDTLRVAVVGDVDPATLGKLLDQTFGSLPAKADLAPVPDVVGGQAAAARLCAARRAADHDHLRRPRRHAPRSEFHGGLCGQPHHGRRRAVVAALSRSPRKARARLFGVRSRCSGWITRRCSSATPARASIAPARRWTRSRMKSAAWPMKVRPSRSWTRRNPI